MHKSISDMTIGERVIFVFDTTQRIIGEILDVSQDTISLWKNGKTPTTEHLKNISIETNVGIEWFLMGKTSDVESITYAFFPIDKEEGILNPTSYIRARSFSGWALSWCHDPIVHEMAIRASAAFFRHATEIDAPDPIEIMNNDSYINFDFSTFESEPDEQEYLEFAAQTPVPSSYLDQYRDKIQYMLECYTPSASFGRPLQSTTPTTELPEISPEDFEEIPFYGDEIAAGQPLAIREAPEGIVIVHKAWCKNPTKMVAVRVASTGTSMEPTIPAGAIVTIDSSQIDPESLLNQVVAIYKHGDGATLKRLARTDRGWCGVPDNRDPEHEIITINEGDRIIGKVNSVHYAL